MTPEQFLAALYTDEAFRARFTRDARATALAPGLSSEDADELARMDMEALRLAARSFEKKRAVKKRWPSPGLRPPSPADAGEGHSR